MIKTKELEYKIYSCLINKTDYFKTVELDEKYFTTKNLLLFLKKEYALYGNIDLPTMTKRYKLSDAQLKEFAEIHESEVAPSLIGNYYKQLIDYYKQNKIELITSQFRRNEITAKELIDQINYYGDIEKFVDKEILSITDIKPYKRGEREYTNIKELDYLLKGIEYGKISLWSGVTNHGKTTLMTQFAKECIKDAKKIFYFSGEQSAEEFKNFLYIGLCKKEELEFITDEHNTRIYDTKPKQQMIDQFDLLYGDYIHVYNNEIPENSIETMIKVMNKAFNQGVRIFFIDNFMQLDNSEKLEEQTKIVEQFKRFARNNNCIVNLVAHPRKGQYQKNRLSIFDISGTQNIANKSTNICSIIRTDLLIENEKEILGQTLAKNNYDINECDAIVEVLKTKGNACRMVGLIYNEELKTYYEAPKRSNIQFEEKKKGRVRE